MLGTKRSGCFSEFSTDVERIVCVYTFGASRGEQATRRSEWVVCERVCSTNCQQITRKRGGHVVPWDWRRCTGSLCTRNRSPTSVSGCCTVRERKHAAISDSSRGLWPGEARTQITRPSLGHCTLASAGWEPSTRFPARPPPTGNGIARTPCCVTSTGGA